MVINQRSRNGSVSLLLDFFLVLCVNLNPLRELSFEPYEPFDNFCVRTFVILF